MTSDTTICPLCKCSNGKLFTTTKPAFLFFDCNGCGLISKNPKDHLSKEQERARYQLHQNDISDPGYQGFISDLIDVVRNKLKTPAKGLDFGSGPSPVISDILNRRGYLMSCFDPYFANDTTKLSQQYDFIISSEVVEHFIFPNREFKLLKKCLKGNAPLIIKTQQYDDNQIFSDWYYIRDRTHVCFYRQKTFEWITRKFQFSKLEILSNRLLILWNTSDFP